MFSLLKLLFEKFWYFMNYISLDVKVKVTMINFLFWCMFPMQFILGWRVTGRYYINSVMKPCEWIAFEIHRTTQIISNIHKDNADWGVLIVDKTAISRNPIYLRNI